MSAQPLSNGLMESPATAAPCQGVLRPWLTSPAAPPPAGAGRALARRGRPGALGAGPEPRQSRLPPAVRPVRLAQGDAGHRARQGRLATRHLPLQLRLSEPLR